MPDSISLLLIAAAGVAAWYAIGCSRDAARQRRRADRLAARNRALAEQVEELAGEVDLLLDLGERPRWDNHPSMRQPRLRAVEESRGPGGRRPCTGRWSASGSGA